MGSLLNSMSLVLEEFYKHLSVVGVSAMTGEGMDEFFKGVQEKKEEFERDYKPELERRKAEREEQKASVRQKELDRLLKDMNVGGTKKGPRKDEPETVSDAEDMEEEENGVVGDPDSDEDLPDADSGLEARYQQALRDSRGDEGVPSGKDLSFLRYMQQANIG